MNHEKVRQGRVRFTGAQRFGIIAAAVVLVCVIVYFVWPRYDFDQRNMNWGMSREEVQRRESVSFDHISLDWCELLQSRQPVKLQGKDATLIYLFADDKLLAAYYYVYNQTEAEAREYEKELHRNFTLRYVGFVEWLCWDGRGSVLYGRHVRDDSLRSSIIMIESSPRYKEVEETLLRGGEPPYTVEVSYESPALSLYIRDITGRG